MSCGRTRTWLWFLTAAYIQLLLRSIPEWKDKIPTKRVRRLSMTYKSGSVSSVSIVSTTLGLTIRLVRWLEQGCLHSILYKQAALDHAAFLVGGVSRQRIPPYVTKMGFFGIWLPSLQVSWKVRKQLSFVARVCFWEEGVDRVEFVGLVQINCI